MQLLPSRALAPALALAALLAAPLSVTAAPPPLTAQPSAVDFGIVNVDWGEQSSTILVQNDGADPVAVGAATIDGPGAGVLRIGSDGCQGQLLGPGSGCNVSAGFDPTDGVAYAATLHVPSDAGELTVPLAGVGGAAHPVASPASLAFGDVEVGSTATRSLTIANAGNLPFQLIVALPTGGDVGAFRVMTDGCSMQAVSPAASCQFRVRFEPLAPGAAQATLTLIRGDAAPVQVSLRGDGAAAPAVVPPATVEDPLGPADVAFGWRAGSPAPFGRGHIDLGIARCVPASACTVTVRPRFFAGATPTAHASRVRGRTVVWRPGRRLRVGLSLPARLRGTPVLLVAALRTRAAGRLATTRTIVVPLVAGRRNGSVIVAAARGQIRAR